MYVHTYRKTVNSQMQTMRRLLIDSIEHPQKYAKHVEDARVVEFLPNGLVREVRKHGATIREGITVAETKNEFRLVSELMEHPFYNGRIVTKIVPTSVQNPMSPLDLQVTVELERKSFKVEGMLPGEEEMAKEIVDEMDLLGSKAEELEHRA